METHYREAKSAADVESVVKSLTGEIALAIAVDSEKEESLEDAEEEGVEEEAQAGMPALTDDPSPAPSPEPAARRIAISAATGSAAIVKLDSTTTASKLRSILTTAATPKSVHDYKAAIHVLDPLGIPLHGLRHDPMLYSYLLDPTYSSHRLADVALRRFNLRLSGDLAEAADVTGRLTTALREDVKQAGLTKLYEEMDLPLVPVLARMEQAGVKIDTTALAKMSTELERESSAKAKEIHELAGTEFNIGSPKQLGDVLFNRLSLPKPVKYGRGRTISTALHRLETPSEEHPLTR